MVDGSEFDDEFDDASMLEETSYSERTTYCSTISTDRPDSFGSNCTISRLGRMSFSDTSRNSSRKNSFQSDFCPLDEVVPSFKENIVMVANVASILRNRAAAADNLQDNVGKSDGGHSPLEYNFADSP